ncbi:transcriptional repressor CTCFL [Scaptodrosophila lebanonensis]|uniref:Transcriptional repressor CTCFL n=1 Tax=Drosophila lebanonensis TaxID=7225 RepID=A0A6J2T8C9_DROLE|nr:transcriptional repressor CTCFL [Scaptodrosophila lebanonensis]
MPKSKPAAEDLQSFINNLHKEVEDGTVITITPENVGEDKVVRKILLASRSGADVGEEEEVDASTDAIDEVEDDIYYVDDEGNCYIKTTPQTQELKKKAIKKSVVTSTPIALRQTPRRSAVNALKAVSVRPVKPSTSVRSTRGMKSQVKLEELEEQEEEEQENEEEVDDPSVIFEDLADNGEVYEFEDVTAETEVNMNDTNFGITTKQYKLKPVAVETGVKHKFACSQCNYTANKKCLITRHMKTHEDDRPFKCSLCDRGFKSNVGLLNHINTHLGKRPHQCKQCDSAFTTSGELIRHTRYKHTKEKPHKCSECSYASVEMTKLRRHMTCHTGERPYQCPHCTYASQDMFKLKRHMVTHTGEKKYQCDICQSRFTQSNSLKSHKLIHSVVNKPVFQCTLCPTTCGRKADLRQHMNNMHSSDKPIPCKRCGQELPDRYQYKLHIKTHDGEKCYRCTLCSYASVSQRHLESHMFIHTDEKPFKCEECNVSFRQHQLLKRHMNLAHNKDYKPPEPRQKMHSCPTCQRSFTHKGNLMRHMETHDPSSLSNEDKLKIKLGRSMRLQPDGSVVTVLNEAHFKALTKAEEEAEDDAEGVQYELIQFTDDMNGELVSTLELGDKPALPAKKQNSPTKPVIINRQLRSQSIRNYNTKAKPLKQSSIKTFRIKEDSEAPEYTVEVQGEEEYMVVEVVNSDDEVSIKQEPTNSTDMKINEKNCFGFENDDDEADGASQEFLDLMDTIEQDT